MQSNYKLAMQAKFFRFYYKILAKVCQRHKKVCQRHEKRTATAVRFVLLLAEQTRSATQYCAAYTVFTVIPSEIADE